MDGRTNGQKDGRKSRKQYVPFNFYKVGGIIKNKQTTNKQNKTTKLEERKVMKRSSDLLNNIKIDKGQLMLII